MHTARFGTNQACRDFLVQVRWGGRPQCPSCGNDHMNYYLRTRNIYKCSQCYKQFSVTQGTIFHKSKIPLTKWFLAIYLFTTKKRGLSSIQMAKWIGIKQHSAWYMLHRLREAMKDENNIVLSGIVEADESFVMPKVRRDKRLQIAKALHDKNQKEINGLTKSQRHRLGIKLKRGRKKGTTKEVIEQQKLERGGKPYSSDKPSQRIPFERGAVLLGMIEQRGRVVMKILGSDDRSINRDNVFPHLKKHISAKAILYTDQLNLYDTTDKLFVAHFTVNHKKTYFENGVHTNNVENAWKHLKKMIDGTYFHLSFDHFNRYLNENTYRWNRREITEREIFESFFPLAIERGITYKELKIKKGNKFAA